MKIRLICLLFIMHLLMSYSLWAFPLSALLGSVFICLIARTAWSTEWRDWLGLRIPLFDAILAIALAPVLMALLYWMIRATANAQNLFYQPSIAERGFLSPVYLQPLGQTLNEEMLFGALLLFSFRQKLGTGRPLLTAALVAISFSILHYVFYRWIVISEYTGRLTAGALFVLFTIGMLRNTLILKSGHIAYSWSLHFSINVIGLVSVYKFITGYELNEPEVFNLILGSRPAVILSSIVLVACWIALSFPRKQSLAKG